MPKLRQSRLLLVKKETPPTVDEAIRPVEVTPQPVVRVSRASLCPFNPSQKKIFVAPPRTLHLLPVSAREARAKRATTAFSGRKIFFWGSFSWYTPISETPNPGGNPDFAKKKKKKKNEVIQSHAFSHIFTWFHTFSHIFTWFHTFSHGFTV